MRLFGRAAAVVASALLFGLGAVACDDTSDYDTDSPSYNDDGDPPPAYNGGDSYDYDDTPDGRFNPSPPHGPYSPSSAIPSCHSSGVIGPGRGVPDAPPSYEPGTGATCRSPSGGSRT
jgi:hypothetical protein